MILLSYYCAPTLAAALFPPLLPTEDNAHLDIFINKQDINFLTRDTGWLFPSPCVLSTEVKKPNESTRGIFR